LLVVVRVAELKEFEFVVHRADHAGVARSNTTPSLNAIVGWIGSSIASGAVERERNRSQVERCREHSVDG
ncbi:MAG TPA: hypothetical protein VMJ74_03895, partial [Pseudomonadales bacterium]|nr:hypothetical protein [Pseudomonadales bacterium]